MTMANDTTLTVIGRLASDPELRFTPSGAPVASFRVLSTPRSFDKQRNEWVDGETLGMNCSVWRETAENVAESLHKGDHVIVVGNLVQRSYTDRDGNKRTVYELQVQEVAPSLRYATAKVTRTQRQGGGQPRGGQAQEDPWATQGGASSYSDEPPF